MHKRVVLTYASGDRYISCAKRMKKVLDRYSGYDIKQWINTLPPESPPHNQDPYAFKAFAFKWAKEEGYDSALWLDSAVWPAKDPGAVFDEIENVGYWICLNGWNQANWSTDEQLKYFGYTREEAIKMPHAMACIVGFSFGDETGNRAYEMYLKAAQDGIFRGPWKNDNGEVSSDKNVLGSRHDQTCLGFIVNKLGLTYRIRNVEYANVNTPPKSKDLPFYTCAGNLKYKV